MPSISSPVMSDGRAFCNYTSSSVHTAQLMARYGVTTNSEWRAFVATNAARVTQDSRALQACTHFCDCQACRDKGKQ